MNIRESVVLASLKIVAEKGWNGLLIQEICSECDLPLTLFLEWFSDKTDVLIAIGQYFDRQVVADIDDVDLDTPLKDRLFETLMSRFDAITDHKKAVLNIIRDIKCDPVTVLVSLPHLNRSMQKMLEVSGEKTNGIRGAFKVYGLAVCYMNTVRVWGEDDSVDLSKTMAALDRNLGYFERLS